MWCDEVAKTMFWFISSIHFTYYLSIAATTLFKTDIQYVYAFVSELSEQKNT